jgi:hypothetical protein
MRKKSEGVPESQRRLSWTPVSRGGLYCSPACGAGCTRKEYDRAVRDADRLVRRLRGSGWRAEVWENLGWHFRAVSGTVQVTGDRRGEGGRLRYTCLISDDVDRSQGGSVLWTDRCPDRCHSDPNEAVASMLDAAVAATVRVVMAVGSAALAAGRAGATGRMADCPTLVEPAGASTAYKLLVDRARSGRLRRRLPN